MTALSFEEMREAFLEEVKRIGKKNIEAAKKMGEPFFTGRIHITDGIRALGYTEDSPELDELYRRYIQCDWGEVKEDAAINERAIQTGYGDVMGIYRLNGHVIWIKTDLNDRPLTTIFLPEEW